MKEKESGEEGEEWEEEEERELANERVRRERKGSRKKNPCAWRQTLAGRSAAGPLAWTGTCIWEKQAAKRGRDMGKQVGNSAETAEQHGAG